MTLPGAECRQRPTPEQAAAFTLRTMQRCVPAAVPAILFLSGGLSEEEASVFLNAIHQAAGAAPWHLGFSYGRAMQQSCLKHWAGHDVAAGQQALLARARANGQAARGTYATGSEPSDGKPLFEANYSY